jgi:hypothetical protein
MGKDYRWEPQTYMYEWVGESPTKADSFGWAGRPTSDKLNGLDG